MTSLYNQADVERWKEGTRMMAEVLELKVSRHVPGDRLPKQFSRMYLENALIALAEQDGNGFLGFLRASVECDLKLWESATTVQCEPETLGSIRQMGTAPIVAALGVSEEFGAAVGQAFENASEFLDAETFSFGRFLVGLNAGQTGNENANWTNAPGDVRDISEAIYLRNRSMLDDALSKGIDSWERYIKSDKGHSNSVCYLVGFAFTRLIQRCWIHDYSPGHELIPEIAVDCVPTKIEIPFVNI